MLVHSLIDPFVADPREDKAREARELRKLIATLEAEMGRLEASLDDLYRRQDALPDNDVWDDVYNDLDYAADRVRKRIDAMHHTQWEAQEKLHWKFDA